MSIGKQYACASINFENASRRRDLRNLLINHAVQHHKCMPAKFNSSITNRYQLFSGFVTKIRLAETVEEAVARQQPPSPQAK